MNKKDWSGLWAAVVRVSPGTAIPSLPYLLTFPAARTPVPWSGSSSIYITRAGYPGGSCWSWAPQCRPGESSHLSENAAPPRGRLGEPTRAATVHGLLVPRTENPPLLLGVMNGSTHSDLSLQTEPQFRLLRWSTRLKTRFTLKRS